MVFIEHVEIVEITADFFGSMHGGVNVKIKPLREWREYIREHAFLNIGGYVELRGNALLLRRDLGQILHIALQFIGHGVEADG